MCKMQKRQVYDIKNLENTTVPSLHDRGQPVHKRNFQKKYLFPPCMTGVNLMSIEELQNLEKFPPCMTGVNLTLWPIVGQRCGFLPARQGSTI